MPDPFIIDHPPDDGLERSSWAVLHQAFQLLETGHAPRHVFESRAVGLIVRNVLQTRWRSGNFFYQRRQLVDGLTSFLIGSLERIGDENRLWVWPVQGGAPRPFGDVLCADAAWSPDGRQVVYSSKGTLYKANSDGSASRPLARKPAYNPKWSADGRKLRFSNWD